MPYKDKLKDRLWHKEHMKIKRAKQRLYKTYILHKAKNDIVTPSTLNPVTPISPSIDADGNIIYDE